MSAVNDGGPAFPLGSTPEEWMNGMTLRDYFAAKAMQAIIGTLSGPVTGEQARGEFDYYATAAYCMADAMLEARGEPR